MFFLFVGDRGKEKEDIEEGRKGKKIKWEKRSGRASKGKTLI